MKKIFTLIAIVCMGISAYAVNNITTEEYVFKLRLANEVHGEVAQDAVGVICTAVLPANCDVFQAMIELPEGVAPIQDPEDDSWAAIPEDSYAGLGVTAKNIWSRIENKSAWPAKDVNGKQVFFLGLDHSLSARQGGNGNFPAGEVDVLSFNLDCSGMADGANYATLIQDPDHSVFSCIDDDAIYEPTGDVKLKLYKKDGFVSQIEVIGANEVPAAQKGIYNLMGVKVNRAEPGQMYIIDGKKVVPTTVIER